MDFARWEWLGWGLGTERVEDEDVEAVEVFERGRGNVGSVGQVSGRTEAIAGNELAAVLDGDGLERGAEERDRAGKGRQVVQRDAVRWWA